MNKIIQATPLPDGNLLVELADGRRGYFDVNPYMTSEFFVALKQEAYFRRVRPFFAGVGCFFLRHCEEGGDRRGNPGVGPSVRSRFQ